MNYTGIIIEESLMDKSILDEVNIVKTEIEPVTEGHKTPWVKHDLYPKKWTLSGGTNVFFC
jgi:hypothetical protein